jgi:hypothetical protein
MINLNLFITEDGGVFYFDAEEYNSKTDVKIEEEEKKRLIFNANYSIY